MGIFAGVIFVLFLTLGMPIGFLIGLIGVFALWQIGLPNVLIMASSRFIEIINSYVLMAIPFFMLSGLIMGRIGVSEKILMFSSLLVGRVRGGIAHMNIMASVFFAGLSGSGLADITGLGSIEIPMMVGAGYDAEYSTAITVASACLGPIIPPSILLVVYGGTMNVSIGGLFIAGIPAGILLAFNLMVANAVISTKRGYPRREYKIDKKMAFKIIKEAVPPLVLPVIILGGIVGGLTTPTEAGAIAVLYALFLGFFYYRNFNLKDLKSVFIDVVKLCGIIFLLIGASGIFSWYVTIARLSDKLGSILLLISSNIYILLFILNIILLIAGMFIDITAALLILSPVLAPIAIKFGIHPLHIGMIIVFNLVLGMMTPPLGLGLYCGCIVGKVKFEKLVISSFPLLLTNIFTLLLITYFPMLIMWLPKITGFY